MPLIYGQAAEGYRCLICEGPTSETVDLQTSGFPLCSRRCTAKWIFDRIMQERQR